MKIEGEASPHKRFQVKRDAHGSDVLASFDTFDEAIADVRRRRSDWRYVILAGRRMAQKPSRNLN